MKKKQFVVSWIFLLMFLYGVGVLWQQHHAIRIQHSIAFEQAAIHLLEEDILVAEQEIAQLKTASYITKALASEEFIQASCHTMMTYS
ncbi:hypothetical protein COB28_00210 [Candidatus Dependentiae bacterium]|nr:MAG: hypothetical protein COB28_00210 [Candidatus Dependentiae bacterium]